VAREEANSAVRTLQNAGQNKVYTIGEVVVKILNTESWKN